jgi:hypothetical protein
VPQVRLNFTQTLTIEDMRRRREHLLRNEILRRIITQLSHQDHQTSRLHSQMMILRAAAISGLGDDPGREFTGEDYDMLS